MQQFRQSSCRDKLRLSSLEAARDDMTMLGFRIFCIRGRRPPAGCRALYPWPPRFKNETYTVAFFNKASPASPQGARGAPRLFVIRAYHVSAMDPSAEQLAEMDDIDRDTDWCGLASDASVALRGALGASGAERPRVVGAMPKEEFEETAFRARINGGLTLVQERSISTGGSYLPRGG